TEGVEGAIPHHLPDHLQLELLLVLDRTVIAVTEAVVGEVVVRAEHSHRIVHGAPSNLLAKSTHSTCPANSSVARGPNNHRIAGVPSPNTTRRLGMARRFGKRCARVQKATSRAVGARSLRPLVRWHRTTLSR